MRTIIHFIKVISFTLLINLYSKENTIKRGQVIGLVLTGKNWILSLFFSFCSPNSQPNLSQYGRFEKAHRTNQNGRKE